MLEPSPAGAEQILIREISRESAAEAEWVARRMEATLVEVEGPENARALHSLDWIRERLRWHLHNPEVCAKVLLAVTGPEIVGHTILRRETDGAGTQFGLVSTTYVLPGFRRLGIGTRLLQAGEAWFLSIGLPCASTWTSATNHNLIRLYERHGYTIAEEARHPVTQTLMVNLARRLSK